MDSVPDSVQQQMSGQEYDNLNDVASATDFSCTLVSDVLFSFITWDPNTSEFV